ncbi:MAG TPA: thioredoxin [Chromatiales bacterium]|nr:thioredoxin [Thiotrichales bacterium]HIP67944.1 thioredoxin [Chromatiales bacterium]
MKLISYYFFLTNLLLVSFAATAASDDTLQFDDTLLEEELIYPDWFELSSGDLRDDLKEAIASGKKGIVIYFGQKRCAYCEQFIKNDLGKDDIAKYMRENYNVIAIDIWGIEDITDTDGETYTEHDLSVKYETNFTPSLIFYDENGEKVFRLRGYYEPYKFRAALRFVVEKFYEKENFRGYLARAEPGLFFYDEGLNERDFFSPPPFDLNRIDHPQKKPLAVFFEQGKCHACDLLHSGPLNDERTIAEIKKMQVVQLNMAADTPVVTPDGQQTTAREWAEQLGLFHTPTILFFNEVGREVFRVDSVVQFYRLWGVLDYINKRAYRENKDYQAWRLQQREVSR